MSHLPIDFLDTSISPIFVTDVDTNCLYVNEAMRDALTLGADVDPNALDLPGLLHRDSEWFIAQHQRIEADGSAIISLKLSSDGRDGDSLWFVVTAFHPSGTEAPQYVFMGVPAAVADRITHANTSASGSSASIENQRVMVDARLASCMEYLRNCNAPAETMEIIFRAAREIFDGAHVELFVVDLEAEMLELRWSSEEAPARTVSHDACWAVRRRRLHYWGPESAEMRCSHDSGEGETSRFCAPISGHDGPLAILSVGFDDRALPDEGALATRRSMISNVASRISLAITNIDLRARLEHAALSDPLTNILNRRAFEQSVQRAIARNRRHKLQFGFVVIDIDHFKELNDDHGHDVADKVLTQLSELLVQQTRTSDTVARLGGGEFGLLLEGASEDEAVLKSEELRKKIEAAPFILDRVTTASLGVTHSSSFEQLTWRDLYGAAARALYLAKGKGRNCVMLGGSS